MSQFTLVSNTECKHDSETVKQHRTPSQSNRRRGDVSSWLINSASPCPWAHCFWFYRSQLYSHCLQLKALIRPAPSGRHDEPNTEKHLAVYGPDIPLRIGWRPTIDLKASEYWTSGFIRWTETQRQMNDVSSCHVFPVCHFHLFTAFQTAQLKNERNN